MKLVRGYAVPSSYPLLNKCTRVLCGVCGDWSGRRRERSSGRAGPPPGAGRCLGGDLT